MKTRYRYCLVMLFVLCTLFGCSKKNTNEEVQPELIIGGTSYSPYFYRDVNGNYAGIDVDIAKEVCKRIGYTPVFKQYDSDEEYLALKEGSIDCLWCCLSMDETSEDYKWVGPYLYTQRSVIVDADSEIETLEDLEGKRVAVQADSTSEEIILNGTISTFPKLGQLTVFSTMGEVFSALKKDYVDAAIGHESALMVYAEDYLDEYRFLNMSLRSEALGVVFQKNVENSLVHAVEQEIQNMRNDGSLEKIVREYGLNIQKNVYGGVMDEEMESDK